MTCIVLVWTKVSGVGAKQFDLSYSLFLPFPRVDYYSNFARYQYFSLAVGCINIHYSLTESVKFFIPNVLTLSIPYSISSLSRFLLFRLQP